MNKKGIFSILMAILVIIGVVYLNVHLTKKFESKNRFMGDAQYPLISLNYETQFFDSFLKESAKLSLIKVIDEIPNIPQLQGLGVTRASAGQCTYLNVEDRPRELYFVPHFHEGITKAFNNHMNFYLSQYAEKKGWEIPLNNFEVYVEKGYLTAVAVRPVIIPIKSFGVDETGKAAYKPSLKIEYDHKLEEYPWIIGNLELVAEECRSLDCEFIYNLPEEWEVKQRTENSIEFRIPRADTELCYALFMGVEQVTT